MTKRKISRGRPSRASSTSRFSMKSKGNSSAGSWLYGGHAVLSALENPVRRCRRLLMTREAQASFGAKLAALGANERLPTPQETGREELSRLLPPGAVHQGLALLADPLPETDLTDLLTAIDAGTATPEPDDAQNSRLLVVLLDQVTDPHNVGAILRSAAAFGAAAVVAPRHHAAPQTGVLAKAASRRPGTCSLHPDHQPGARPGAAQGRRPVVHRSGRQRRAPACRRAIRADRWLWCWARRATACGA